jgi:hypothetical protein
LFRIQAVATNGDVFEGRGSTGTEDELAPSAVTASAARDIPCRRAGTRVAVMPPRVAVDEGEREIVVEGCGQRVTYLETCGGFDPIVCRYVMTARMSVGSAEPPAQGRPPATP